MLRMHLNNGVVEKMFAGWCRIVLNAVTLFVENNSDNTTVQSVHFINVATFFGLPSVFKIKIHFQQKRVNFNLACQGLH